MNLFTEIQHAEYQLREAMLAGDVAALEVLLSDEVRAVGPDGTLVGKAEDLAAHRTGTVRLHAMDPLETTFQAVSDVVIAFVLMQLAGTFQGQPFAGRYRYTRVWSQSSGRWQVVAAHISAVPG